MALCGMTVSSPTDSTSVNPAGAEALVEREISAILLPITTSEVETVIEHVFHRCGSWVALQAYDGGGQSGNEVSRTVSALEFMDGEALSGSATSAALSSSSSMKLGVKANVGDMGASSDDLFNTRNGTTCRYGIRTGSGDILRIINVK